MAVKNQTYPILSLEHSCAARDFTSIDSFDLK